MGKGSGVQVRGATKVGGRYLLGERIGRGGMADVFRATDEVLGREVAVKVLRGETEDEAAPRRFVEEARTLARLNHPGVVTLLDVGIDTDGDGSYLVMELVEGPSLSAACSHSPLAPRQAALIGAQVAAALAAAHEQGIVHRDVKPGNVLLDSDGRARLADFGIARFLGDSARLTRTGLMVGSPAYLAPEQVQGGEVTAAVDVYALGLVLLEALTGQATYAGTPIEAALARLASPPEIPDSLPEPWRSVLGAMTALDPADRLTADQAAAALADVAEGRSPVSPPGTLPERESRSRDAELTRTIGPLIHEAGDVRGGRLTVLTGAVLTFVAVLLLVVLALSDTTESPTGGEPESAAKTAPQEPAATLPDGVPAKLRKPLLELHQTVEGAQ